MARTDIYLDAMLRHLGAGRHQDLVTPAIQMMWDVDGVVDVRNRINEPKPAPAPSRS